MGLVMIDEYLSGIPSLCQEYDLIGLRIAGTYRSLNCVLRAYHDRPPRLDLAGRLVGTEYVALLSAAAAPVESGLRYQGFHHPDPRLARVPLYPDGPWTCTRIKTPGRQSFEFVATGRTPAWRTEPFSSARSWSEQPGKRHTHRDLPAAV